MGFVSPYIEGSTILVCRIYQELCGICCSNIVCTLHMERERSLFIVKVQIFNVKVTWPLLRISALDIETCTFHMYCLAVNRKKLYLFNFRHYKTFLIWLILLWLFYEKQDGFLCNFILFLKSNCWFKVKAYMSGICCYTQYCSCSKSNLSS